MKTANTVQQGVSNLFTAADRPLPEYTYLPAGEGELSSRILVNDEAIPVLYWRFGIFTHSLYNLVPQLGKPSVLKSWSFAPSGETLAQQLFRELDYAEFLLRSKISSVMGYGTAEAANFIIRMENGALVNLETAVTLPEGSRKEVRHNLYTTNGMASDLVADNVVFQDQVHLFADKREAYTDDDINLYGLSLEEQDVCYSVFALLEGREDAAAWKDQANRMQAIVEGALDTLVTGERYII